MSEMALTADHLIVIGRGRLIADTSVDDFVAQALRARSSASARPRPARSRRLLGDRTSRSSDGRARTCSRCTG